MQPLHERPEVRHDRMAAIVTLAGVLSAALWLSRQILQDVEANHSWEFIALAAMLGVGVGLGWLLYIYATAEYRLLDGVLILRHAIYEVQVPLDRMVRLYRWRQRWTWTGNALKDLGVPDVEQFPPIWWVGKKDVWVVVYEADTQERYAVSLRPSEQLLALLKAWAWERSGTGSGA